MGAWAVNIVVFAIFFAMAGNFTSSSVPIYCCVVVQVICNYIYVKVFLKLEENIGAVLMNNSKIPSTVYGYFESLVYAGTWIETNTTPALDEMEVEDADIGATAGDGV